MKIGVSIWVLITLIYVAFSKDSDFWNTVYFMKESLTSLFLLVYIRNLNIIGIKKYINIALSICVLRGAYGLAVLSELISENTYIVTTVYMVFIGIILITLGYDRRKKR